MTANEMAASITRWLKENEDQGLIFEAISDGLGDLWEALMMVSISEFLGTTVQSINFASAADHASLISIADPIAGPTVSVVAQGALATTRNYLVAYTLVTESGSETVGSPTSAVAPVANQIAKVASPAQVAGTIGWNCYVNGLLQNDAPLSWGVDFYEPEGTGFDLTLGDKSVTPVENTTADDIWYIKDMYVRDGQNMETYWTQAELGGRLWKSMAKSIASSSPYQSYAFDVVGGDTVAIRPLAGGVLNPSFFYVKRPRQIKFGSAQIPFVNRHPGSDAYIRYRSLQLIHLSNHEYTSASYWGKEAAVKLQAMTITANTKNEQKVQYIKPLFK